jgi:hypothetical protein
MSRLPGFDEPTLGPCNWSPCKKYRYTLWREWGDPSRYVQFIGLNPSRANEHENDNTLKRCIRFAQDWGFGAMYMTNLFAFVTPYPTEMRRAEDPIGPENDHWLTLLAEHAEMVVACWGCDSSLKKRDAAVLEMIGRFGPVHCFRRTKGGYPEHPLYMPANTEPIVFHERVTK